MTMFQRVLVTGGAGFIGSHTVDLLLRENKQVIVLDNLSTGKIENLDLSHPNLEFVEGDILEYPLIVDLLAGCDAVLHLAALSSVPQSIAHPIYSFQVNTQGLLHVLQAIQQRKPALRLVYASSAAVYGIVKELPCRDEANIAGNMALSPYALQKIHDEDYATLYRKLYGINSLGLRYFNVYGLRQDPASPYSGVISRFLSAYQQNKILTIFGNGQQSRDFIHVSDVARANVLALQRDDARDASAANMVGVEVLNIGTGVPQSLLDLISCMEQIGGRAAQVVHQPARAGDIPSSYAAVARAEEVMGFHAQLSLLEGMQEMMAAPE